MKFIGACLCGEVQFEIISEQKLFYMCHCRTCRKSSANLFASYFQIKKSQFSLLKGVITDYSSSPSVKRGFCQKCGTHIYFNNRESLNLDMSLGVIDQPRKFKPAAHIHYQQKFCDIEGLVGIDKYDD